MSKSSELLIYPKGDINTIEINNVAIKDIGEVIFAGENDISIFGDEDVLVSEIFQEFIIIKTLDNKYLMKNCISNLEGVGYCPYQMSKDYLKNLFQITSDINVSIDNFRRSEEDINNLLALYHSWKTLNPKADFSFLAEGMTEEYLDLIDSVKDLTINYNIQILYLINTYLEGESSLKLNDIYLREGNQLIKDFLNDINLFNHKYDRLATSEKSISYMYVYLVSLYLDFNYKLFKSITLRDFKNINKFLYIGLEEELQFLAKMHKDILKAIAESLKTFPKIERELLLDVSEKLETSNDPIIIKLRKQFPINVNIKELLNVIKSLKRGKGKKK